MRHRIDYLPKLPTPKCSADKDIEDLNYLPKVLKDRFDSRYPAGKAYTSDFIRDGIRFRIDAVAYKK